jgi:hypothetical protein
MTDPLSQSVWTRKRHLEEATRSWWLDAGTREEFSAAADREQSRILRSKAATMTLGSNIIVGWTASGRKP